MNFTDFRKNTSFGKFLCSFLLNRLGDSVDVLTMSWLIYLLSGSAAVSALEMCIRDRLRSIPHLYPKTAFLLPDLHPDFHTVRFGTAMDEAVFNHRLKHKPGKDLIVQILAALHPVLQVPRITPVSYTHLLVFFHFLNFSVFL